MEGTGLTKLDRSFALCEPVLRQMTIKLESRLVEPILANARGENIVMSSQADAEEKQKRQLQELKFGRLLSTHPVPKPE